MADQRHKQTVAAVHAEPELQPTGTNATLETPEQPTELPHSVDDQCWVDMDEQNLRVFVMQSRLISVVQCTR